MCAAAREGDRKIERQRDELKYEGGRARVDAFKAQHPIWSTA